MSATAHDREALTRRQRDVLAALLSEEVPDGFDARSARLTSRVLIGKRASEVLQVVPALRAVPGLRAALRQWSARAPREACAHDEALAFIVEHPDLDLPEPWRSVRAVERVYRRHARLGRDRRPGERPWVVALGDRVWHLGVRQR